LEFYRTIIRLKEIRFMSNTDFNKLAKEIHQYNKEAGWWDGDREIETALMLVVTEIAEATEGERKDLMDDHLPTRKMGEVELSDALIRMLDIGGYLGLQYGDSFEWVFEGSIYFEHLNLTDCVTALYRNLAYRSRASEEYSYFINGVYEIGLGMGYDINAAMYEKIEYNKTRPDHKKENRAKVGGKKV
jgi:hypothetical protein